jgi:hypothetical protein
MTKKNLMPDFHFLTQVLMVIRLGYFVWAWLNHFIATLMSIQERRNKLGWLGPKICTKIFGWDMTQLFFAISLAFTYSIDVISYK